MLYSITFIISSYSIKYTELIERLPKEFKCYTVPTNYKEIEVILANKTSECVIPLDILVDLNDKTLTLIDCLTGKVTNCGDLIG